MRLQVATKYQSSLHFVSDSEFRAFTQSPPLILIPGVGVTVVKRNGQLVKLRFCQSVVRSFVYHSSRSLRQSGSLSACLALISSTIGS